jgi:hypothetical protein
MLPGVRFAGHKSRIFSVFLALLQVFSFSLYILVNIFLPYFLGVTLKDMQDYDFNQSSVLKSTTRWSA